MNTDLTCTYLTKHTMQSPPMSPLLAEGESKVNSKSNSLKVLLIGDSGVGKTNIISRLTSGSFDLESKASVGLVRSHMYVQMGDRKVRVYLWDTGKPDKDSTKETKFTFDSRTSICFVYDVTKRNTFKNIESKWITYLREYYDFNAGAAMVVANKVDLSHLRDVQKEVGRKFAEKNGFLFAEISALENSNVDSTLQKLLSELTRKIGIEEASLNESLEGISLASSPPTSHITEPSTVYSASSCIIQ